MKCVIIHTILAGLFLLPVMFIKHSNAWLYPEHREIGKYAIEDLNPRYKLLLDQLWQEARIGYELRLPESVIDPTPGYIDYASWPAIAGDHSCSPENMLRSAKTSSPMNCAIW